MEPVKAVQIVLFIRFSHGILRVHPTCFGFLIVKYVQVEGAVSREGTCPNTASQRPKTLEIVNHGAEPPMGGWDVLE